MSFLGANPSHEQKCFTAWNRDMSVPISDRMTCARAAEIPISASQRTLRVARFARPLVPLEANRYAAQHNDSDD
jgi:hypothetical protein